MIGLISIVLLSVYFLVQRNKMIALPKPTGQFTVGRTEYEWIDASRNETFSETPGDKRKLSVWIWYPADLNQNAKKTEYFPDMWETVQEKDSGITSYLQQSFKSVQTNSFQGIPLSTRQTAYPVVIFEPGMGNIVFNYTTLIENLASHGYIVVGINPTYSSRYVVFSDGNVAYRTPQGSIPEGNPTDEQLNEAGSRLIKTWSEDIAFVVKKLGEINIEQGSIWKDHIDMEHIGAFGHSFGGTASVKALLSNRIKASIDIDGFLYGVENNPEKPLMFIMSQHQQGDIDALEYKKIQDSYNGLKGDGYLLEIQNSAHYNFMDNAIFFSPIAKAMGVFGTINGEHGLEIANSYITAFFDKYLQNIDSNILKQKLSSYPDVKIQIK